MMYRGRRNRRRGGIDLTMVLVYLAILAFTGLILGWVIPAFNTWMVAQ